MVEDEYSLVGDGSDIDIGDIVVYGFKEREEVVHVGIVADIRTDFGSEPTIRVLSKWGKDGILTPNIWTTALSGYISLQEDSLYGQTTQQL